MASILKATSTVGARLLKPFSGPAKDVKSRLERLRKVHVEKNAEETTSRGEKREERDKGKAQEEEPKKENWCTQVGLPQRSSGPLCPKVERLFYHSQSSWSLP